MGEPVFDLLVKFVVLLILEDKTYLSQVKVLEVKPVDNSEGKNVGKLSEEAEM